MEKIFNFQTMVIAVIVYMIVTCFNLAVHGEWAWALVHINYAILWAMLCIINRDNNKLRQSLYALIAEKKRTGKLLHAAWKKATQGEDTLKTEDGQWVKDGNCFIFVGEEDEK